MNGIEYSATEIRRILQELFPQRRLVLSQLTFFNQVGVAKPTGTTFRRGRRCYRLEDLLSVACMLALKEEGIPYKNVANLPALVQQQAQKIFALGTGCRLSGFSDNIVLQFPGESLEAPSLQQFLAGDSSPLLFWGFDVGVLASQLQEVAHRRLFPAILAAA